MFRQHREADFFCFPLSPMKHTSFSRRGFLKTSAATLGVAAFGRSLVLLGAEQFEGRYSCLTATATNLLGPYSARYESVPHAGHNMFFKDERGQWWSSYFGSDKTAPWRERPGLLPIEFSAEGRIRLSGQTNDSVVPSN
jgi:hypothetical protein